VVLAKQGFGLRGREVADHPQFIPFSARTQMSGLDYSENGRLRQIRKGSAEAIRRQIAAAFRGPKVELIRDELVGVISLSDIAEREPAKRAARTLRAVAAREAPRSTH